MGYHSAVTSKLILILAVSLLTIPASAQQTPEAPAAQPQVKVNVLNVCTPSAEEEKEIAAALARVPKQPLFAADFEISHGRSTLSEPPNFLQPGSAQKSDETSVANYVRIRREFSVQALFSRVQYSFSNDGQNMVETLVLHVRDPKDLIQVSMEDSASAISSPETMVAANTPASRVRLERFGKSSIALARCAATENGPAPDQSAYEPLFRSASEVLANYRSLLGVRHTVPAELAQIPGAGAPEAVKPKSSKPAAKQTQPRK
ncbi:MAG TPA: hypothetical protein VN310_19885 [Candidatus Dormibacteraeota bacterium]|jgi:hypothetical protein|nr:hypothetical protein [Candidatus Dormibacteraeota bacterium]